MKNDTLRINSLIDIQTTLRKGTIPKTFKEVNKKPRWENPSGKVGDEDNCFATLAQLPKP